MSIDESAEPQSFPDDSALSARVRSLDQVVGRVEQLALFLLLGAVVLIGVTQAVATRFHHSFEWSTQAIRDGVFILALLGAAFATQQQRNLSMDLISRRLSPRGRLVLRLFLALFTIFAAYLFFVAGEAFREQAAQEKGDTLLSRGLVAALMPLGAGLIMFHSGLQFLIDLDYLRRGKTPPERQRSAH